MGQDGGSGGNRWQGYSHQELYDMLHSGPGAAASGGVADQWSELSGALTDIQQELNAGVRGSGATWVGTAGDAARGALGPLGEWAQQASTAADVMRISTELQGDLLGKARAAMPAPVPVPQQPGQIGQLLSAQIDYEVAEMANQVAEQQAYLVMAQYEAATDDNTSTLGDFGEPPTLVVDSAPMAGPVVRTPVESPDAPGSSSRPSFGTSPSTSEAQESTSHRTTRTPAAKAAVVEGAEEAGSVSDAGPGTGVTTGASTSPTTTTPSGTTAPSTTAPSTTAPSTMAPSTTAPSTTAPSSTAPPGRATPTAPTAPETATPGTAPSSYEPTEPSGDPVVTPESGAPAIPASRDRDSGSRFSGGALVPAARRADDDPDDVHESKYLIEADDIYGDPRSYTPPVIGESPRHR